MTSLRVALFCLICTIAQGVLQLEVLSPYIDAGGLHGAEAVASMAGAYLVICLPLLTRA